MFDANILWGIKFKERTLFWLNTFEGYKKKMMEPTFFAVTISSELKNQFKKNHIIVVYPDGKTMNK